MRILPLTDRLPALRAWLAQHDLDGFILPRGDEHMGEDTPPNAARLAWLTGFTGSAGFAVVLPQHAAIFTDGRYTQQLDAQAPPEWERRHLVDDPPLPWLTEHAPGARIGFDPWLIGEEQLTRHTEAGLRMVPLPDNPIDALWADRPAPPLAPLAIHTLDHAGRSSADKRAEIAGLLRDAKQDAAILTDPASIAWLFNVRGADLEFTPFPLSFALQYADGRADLFVAPEKIDAPVRAWLGNEVAVRPRTDLQPALQALSGKRVRVDPAATPVWFAQALRASNAEVAAAPDPCLLPKATKNAVEQDGARAAHRRDAIALCQFLHELAAGGAALTELQASHRLTALRAALPEARGDSFAAIAGAGPHGAIMHYRVTPETDRVIGENTVFLIDSGGQYADGTTDVTRTVWIGPEPAPAEVRTRATLVLKGLIAIADAVFPTGVAGVHLDALARRALWDQGLDYDHGTGHGVGSYLAVHEGPAGISRNARPVPLAPGMILSDEPGFYLPGHYGIRLENLLLVRPVDKPGAAKPFLGFETLTLAPFDRALIDPALLDPKERAWLEAYHAHVHEAVSPHVSASVRAWLMAACSPL